MLAEMFQPCDCQVETQVIAAIMVQQMSGSRRGSFWRRSCRRASARPRHHCSPKGGSVPAATGTVTRPSARSQDRGRSLCRIGPCAHSRRLLPIAFPGGDEDCVAFEVTHQIPNALDDVVSADPAGISRPHAGGVQVDDRMQYIAAVLSLITALRPLPVGFILPLALLEPVLARLLDVAELGVAGGA